MRGGCRVGRGGVKAMLEHGDLSSGIVMCYGLKRSECLSRTVARTKRRVGETSGHPSYPRNQLCTEAKFWPYTIYNVAVPSRVRCFRKKNFRFKAKRSETRSVSHAFRFFRFKFFASDQSQINRAYFRFVLLPKIFPFASFRFSFVMFCFISFSFRFRCENKRKNTFFASKQKNFASVSLYFALKRNMMAVFRFRFASFHFEAKIMAVFRFTSLRSENDGSFSLLFRFVFAMFHFRFASDFYVSHRCETSEIFNAKMTAPLVPRSYAPRSSGQKPAVPGSNAPVLVVSVSAVPRSSIPG